MENNLVNVREKDIVYQITCEQLVETLNNLLPSELKRFLTIPQIQLLATDTFFLHYSLTPILRDVNPDKIMNMILEFQKEYTRSESYARVKALTTLDHTLSMIYSQSLITALITKIKEYLEQQKVKQEQQEQQGGRRGQGGSGEQEQQGQQEQRQEQGGQQGESEGQEEGGKQGEGSKEELGQHGQGGQESKGRGESEQEQEGSKEQGQREGLIDLQNLKVMLREAAEEARKIVENISEVRTLIGGREAGKEPGTLTFLSDLANKILEKKVDIKIIELAGRIGESMPLYVKIKKERDVHGDELGGYSLTRKVEKALPRELALPEELFYYKLASRGLLTKEKLTVKEGAFYVLIDKSGSMADGEKTIWARAVALALLKLAQKKRRRFYVRFFDTNVYSLLSSENIESLLRYILELRSDGGTSIDNALETALDDIAELKDMTNTIIIITDGEDNVTIDVDKFKKVNATLVAVMIAGVNETLRKLAEATGGRYLKAMLTKEGALTLIDMLRR